jgi:CheY-like chemotaxis protein
VICESEGIGKGSTFTVTLPNISETSNQSVTSQFIDPARANQNLKIIVVDDNIDAADMLQILLEEIGYEVIVAYEPYAALKIIENKSPDVVFLDIGLPGINGYELARRIRMMPSDHYPFLIALTGYGQNDDRKEAFEAGFDDHFTKPLTMEKLITLLNSTTVKIQDRSYWG